MERKVQIYYGHSKKIYDTLREHQERDFIIQTYPKASGICPNKDLGELSDFKKYLKIVDKCNMVIVSELEGYVGKGVLCEIARAFSNGMHVKVIREKGGKLFLFDVAGFEIENESDWKYRYAKLIVNK